MVRDDEAVGLDGVGLGFDDEALLSVCGRSSSRQLDDDDAGAAEVDQGDQGVGGVQAESW